MLNPILFHKSRTFCSYKLWIIIRSGREYFVGEEVIVMYLSMTGTVREIVGKYKVFDCI